MHVKQITMGRISLLLCILTAFYSSDVLAQVNIQPGISSIQPLSQDARILPLAIMKDISFHGAMAAQPFDPLFFRDREYYLRKSRRQKRTAWILLGTGVALITTGIIVGNAEKDDDVARTIAVVFISGPGVITSLVSIPFFNAAARNKRKANSLTSSVELLRSPVLLQAGSRYNVYPGLAVKMRL